MHNYKLSVIIPTYRPSEYLLDCINSLREQTLCKSLFEVILVLNGEKEPFYSEIQNQIADFSNFALMYISTAGVSKARNVGINSSKGTHVIFIDDDDFVSDDFLEKMYNTIAIAPLNLVVSNFLKYYSNDRIEDDYMTDFYKKYRDNYDKFSLIKNRKVLSSSCGKAIPKEVICRHRFNENVRISEDALFMFEISKNIKGISFIPIDVSYYRRIRMMSASRVKVSVFANFSILLQNINNFSKVYVKNFSQYSFLFYLNRIMAISKYFIISFKNS